MNIVKPARPGMLLAAMALAGLASCDRHHDANPLAKADPSAIVIGTPPAEPSGDPPGTTPVVREGATEVSKSVEQGSMPLPGQPNDHSNVAATPSQRAETSDVNKNAPSAGANTTPSTQGQ